MPPAGSSSHVRPKPGHSTPLMDNSRRVPKSTPSKSESSSPRVGDSRTPLPRVHQNPYADRQSTHPELQYAIPPSVSQRSKRSPTPQMNTLKIPYSSLQKAGPQNAKMPPSSYHHSANHKDATAGYGKAQMDKLNDKYEEQLAGRGRAQGQTNPAQRAQTRRRGSSLGRFVKWIKKVLDGDESTSSQPTAHDTRPSTAPSRSDSPQKPVAQPFPTRQSPVSTGIRASFDKPHPRRQTSYHAGDSKPQQQPSTGYVRGPSPQQQKPAGFDYSKHRETTGTTWTNFLELTNKSSDAVPPVPSMPSKSTTPQIARKPVPTAPRTKTSPAPSSVKSATPSSSSSSPSHSHKPSASKFLTKVTHPARRDSTESDLSFMCSGVDDEALEVTNPKRAAIISQQKRQRVIAEQEHARQEAERNQHNKIFAQAKADAERKRRAAAAADAEAEARLEERLRQSLYGDKHAPTVCARCRAKTTNKSSGVCTQCGTPTPTPTRRYDSPIGSEGGCSTSSSGRPTSTASTVYNVDLTSFDGRIAARPASSVYPDDATTKRAGGGGGYADPGNPFARPAVPPVPVPTAYKSADGVSRDTAFYREIEAVQDCYASTPRSARHPRR